MSRWFRHYAGMMRDEKLVAVAVKAKQSVERVLWVWGAILESAAEMNDGGRFELDCGEAAYFLRCDEGELADIVRILDDMGRICSGHVSRWSDRQYESDNSTERVRRHRAATRSQRSSISGEVPNSKCNDDETLHVKHVTPPETETETDTERNTQIARVKILEDVTATEEKHRTQAQDLLDSATLSDWEKTFLGSIKASRRITGFQRDKLQAIIEAHANAPPLARGKYTAADLRKLGLNV